MDHEQAPQVAYRADWYPDPTRRFEFRYHNGTSWTGDVSVDGDRFIDPLPQPSGNPLAGGGAIPAAAYGYAPTRPLSTGKATTAMVLGIASVVVGWVPFVFALGVAAAVVAIVLAINMLRQIRLHPTAPVGRARAFARAGLILAPIGLALSVVGVWLTVVAYREVDRFTNIGSYTTTDTKCAVSDGVVEYRGTLTNLSSKTRSYHLVVEFLRPDTTSVLYTATTDVDDVAPGGSGTWSVSHVVTADDLDCRVDTVTGPLPFGQS